MIVAILTSFIQLLPSISKAVSCFGEQIKFPSAETEIGKHTQETQGCGWSIDHRSHMAYKEGCLIPRQACRWSGPKPSAAAAACVMVGEDFVIQFECGMSWQRDLHHRRVSNSTHSRQVEGQLVRSTYLKLSRIPLRLALLPVTTSSPSSVDRNLFH
jgi:hypothetical protein